MLKFTNPAKSEQKFAPRQAEDENGGDDSSGSGSSELTLDNKKFFFERKLQEEKKLRKERSIPPKKTNPISTNKPSQEIKAKNKKKFVSLSDTKTKSKHNSTLLKNTSLNSIPIMNYAFTPPTERNKGGIFFNPTSTPSELKQKSPSPNAQLSFLSPPKPAISPTPVCFPSQFYDEYNPPEPEETKPPLTLVGLIMKIFF